MSEDKRAVYASVGRGGYSIEYVTGRKGHKVSCHGYGGLKDLVTGHAAELVNVPIVDCRFLDVTPGAVDLTAWAIKGPIVDSELPAGMVHNIGSKPEPWQPSADDWRGSNVHGMTAVAPDVKVSMAISVGCRVGSVEDAHACSACDGTGKVDDGTRYGARCDSCDGDGIRLPPPANMSTVGTRTYTGDVVATGLACDGTVAAETVAAVMARELKL